MSSDAPTIAENDHHAAGLEGQRVHLVGRFASVPRRQAAAAVERRGGELDDRNPGLIVVGENATTAERDTAGELARTIGAELISESELWRRLGLVEDTQGTSRLYSPAMLAELVEAPLAAVRRWERRELLLPTSHVNRLAFYDFEEARIAQQLADLLKALGSLAAVDAIVDRLAEAFPESHRPIADFPLVIEGGEVLLRSGDTLSETTGQRRLDFESDESSDDHFDDAPAVLQMPEVRFHEPVTLRERAWLHAEEGRIADAIESWRLALLESAPSADDHFVLAEWLYADSQQAAARERYYAALELDPDHLEARVNLGCVLADLGELELAAASVQGAIDQHESYPDAHFHLARIHHLQGDSAAARPHWKRFLDLAPESPWASEAAERLVSDPADSDS